MGPEFLVLGGDERLLQLVGDGAHRHENAPFRGVFGQQLFVIPGIEPAHHLGLVVAQPVQGRQFRRRISRIHARRTRRRRRRPTTATSVTRTADRSGAARQTGAGVLGVRLGTPVPRRSAGHPAEPRLHCFAPHPPRPLSGCHMGRSSVQGIDTFRWRAAKPPQRALDDPPDATPLRRSGST